ncbi:hypothetical protein [Flavobacterium sp. Root420]|uniref:hypothetical protein n=1 Tax=Flavobacterium sp. Root420 TaxID=1736533 RepID=UPI000A653E81|nr:hypothetical protein [Flavobacterium sp. Root420]
MIQSKFMKIFSVLAYHTFFDNNKCNCLHFIPDNKTENILQKSGFRINTVSNGFEVFYSAAAPIINMLDHIYKTTSQDYFEFNIKSSNQNFVLFTALPINWLGQIIYSSQNSKNNNGNIDLIETLETKESNPFLGQLKIYFEDLKKYLNNPDSVVYEINFKARETQWQYYIINKNAVLLNNPAITEKGNIQFEGPDEVTIQTGEQALLFTSTNKQMALSEKPKYKFDLININGTKELNQKNTNSKIIIKSLPIPDVSRMKVIQNSQGSQAASPMYIYL